MPRDLLRYIRDAWNERIVCLQIDKQGAVFNPIVTAASAVSVLMVIGAINDARLDRVYLTDAIAPHHVRWHSAYLALALHPEWPLYKPFDQQPDQFLDQVAWEYYVQYADLHGLPKVSRITSGTFPGGLTPLRLHEKVIRHGFFEFAFKNPGYVLELFAYYKPKLWIETHVAILRSIPAAAYLMFIPLLFFARSLFVNNASTIGRRELFAALLIVWAFSLLPSVFAYPAALAFADHFCASVLLISAAVAGADRKALMLVQPVVRLRLVQFVIATALVLVVAFWAGSQLLRKPEIRVVEATYGLSCKDAQVLIPGTVIAVKQGNATEFASKMCSGRTGTCTVPISATRLGDPAPGCGKDFQITWRCGTSEAVHRAVVEGEAHKKSASLSCKRGD